MAVKFGIVGVVVVSAVFEDEEGVRSHQLAVKHHAGDIAEAGMIIWRVGEYEVTRR